MGRKPCCEKVGLKRGPWAAEEDKKLVSFINIHGIPCWRAVPKLAGLLRCGKSCRLRWTNYLRPDLKRGAFTEAEENAILELHATLGNRWSRIAVQLPGRTDNEIKNYWNTRLKKRLRSMGLDPNTHKPVGATRTGSNTEVTADPEEKYSPVRVPSSHNSPEDSNSPPAKSLGSEAVGAQLTTFNVNPGWGSLPLVDTIPKSEPTPMDFTQSGLQSSSSDVAVNVKLEQITVSPNRSEYSHNPSVFYTHQDGPKFEVEPGPFMCDLHLHARHLYQEEKNVAPEHEVPELSEELAASFLRQTSGCALSDVVVENWSFWEDGQGQSVSCSGSTFSWNDFFGTLQLPGAGRISHEPELQKLAAILDQI